MKFEVLDVGDNAQFDGILINKDYALWLASLLRKSKTEQVVSAELLGEFVYFLCRLEDW